MCNEIADHRSSNQSFKTNLHRKVFHQKMGSKVISIPKIHKINPSRQTNFQIRNSV